MKRALLAVPVLLIFFLPVGTHAAQASLFAGRSLIISTSSPANAYAAGVSVVVAAPVGKDLSAAGGSITTTAPIAGDALFAGGSVTSRAAIAGNMRAVGGTITSLAPVGGDLAAFGYSVTDTAPVSGSGIIAAADVTLDGVRGPVTIYGNNVRLDGHYGSDVTIAATGRITLSASTTIAGVLSYKAPDAAVIPDTAVISGGVRYQSTLEKFGGQPSRLLTFASFIVFVLVRILGALVLAGLVAGLFPRISEQLADSVQEKRFGALVGTVLLGFVIVIATPILCLLLAITFIGVGIALLFFVAYLFLLVLSVVFAAILIGALLARRLGHRRTVHFSDGILGMLLLSLLTLIPIIGLPIVLIVIMCATGALAALFARHTFLARHDSRVIH